MVYRPHHSAFKMDVELYVEGCCSKEKFVEKIETAASDKKYGDIIKDRNDIYSFEAVQEVADYAHSLEGRKLLRFLEGMDALIYKPASETDDYNPYRSRLLEGADLKMTPACLLASETLRQTSMQLPEWRFFLDKSFPGTEKWGFTTTNPVKEFYKGRFREGTYMYEYGDIDVLLAKETEQIKREIEYVGRKIEKMLARAKKAVKKDEEGANSSSAPITNVSKTTKSQKTDDDRSGGR